TTGSGRGGGDLNRGTRRGEGGLASPPRRGGGGGGEERGRPRRERVRERLGVGRGVGARVREREGSGRSYSFSYSCSYSSSYSYSLSFSTPLALSHPSPPTPLPASGARGEKPAILLGAIRRTRAGQHRVSPSPRPLCGPPAAAGAALRRPRRRAGRAVRLVAHRCRRRPGPGRP